MILNQDLSDFGHLIGSIYEGALEEKPWYSFLNKLQSLLDGKYAALILRPPTEEVDGIMSFAYGTEEDGVFSYNKHYFALDPFAELPNKQVVSLDEIISPSDWEKHEYYTQFLKQRDAFHILGVDINTPEGIECRIRICRGKAAENFNQNDKDLLGLLIEHLERATYIHLELDKMEIERNLYAGAVSQLAVGTIILNESGEVLHTNQVAQQLLEEKDGVKIHDHHLMLNKTSSNQELKELIQEAIIAHKNSQPHVAGALRVSRPSGHSDLNLVVRTVESHEWSEGKQIPCVAIFLSDPEQLSDAPAEIIRTLFGLTPAEAQIALLLANGMTLDEASEEQSISRNTARAHLRSIYFKTGVSRQTMLVRLILRSVANLG